MFADPSSWPRDIYATADVRAIDRRAIDELGIPGFELMQRAGKASLSMLRERWPKTRSIRIYCGAGNNAGDGYVVAALALREDLDVEVVAVVDPASLTGDAGLAWQMAQAAGVRTVTMEKLSRDFEPDVVVDALLGTGLARDVDGPFAEAVDRLNRGRAPVLALDIPTGLDSDDGSVRGAVVEADATITFVGLKTGLYLGQGPAFRGELGFSGLQLPGSAYDRATPRFRRLDSEDCGSLLKRRSRITHKGLNGRVLVVGGSRSMAGAARLAAEAALRAGAGLVYAAVHPSCVGSVMAGRPEIMCRGIEGPAEIENLASQVDVIVVGPGLGRDEWGSALVEAMLHSEATLVLDADGLNHLAENPRKRDNWVLTPHPAEAARLLGTDTTAVQRARDQSVAELARRYGAISVLKGACSLVGQDIDSEKVSVAVCDYGNPGMATAGTGDVLAGVIGGLIAQYGLSAETVEVGVMVHALAGDDAARQGERGMLASDLVDCIRRRVNPG